MASDNVSDLFDPDAWVLAPGAEDYRDITSHVSPDGHIARIDFDRPEVRNAFRPSTVDELYRALEIARTDPKIGAVLLTGNGPSRRTAAGRSAREAISASGGATATSTPTMTPP